MVEGFPDLFAYVGEDEWGSGVVGLKQATTAAGHIPLVAIESHRDRLESNNVRIQLEGQARRFGKTIRLVRYVPTEVVLEIGE